MFTRQRAISVASRVSQVVTLTTIVAAAATVLTVVWFTQVQHEQLLAVTSGSMAPTFNTGDVVISAPVRKTNLHAGQIITFGATRTREPTTHRIVSVVNRPDGLFLQTKGDANPVKDPNLIRASSVSGVMTGSIPYFGRWLAFYQEGMGKALLLGIPLCLIVIGQLRSLFTGREREDAEAALVPATS